MAFVKRTSPHAHTAGSAGNVMLQVILATIPGVAALTLYFGYGSLINIALASCFCLAFEASALTLRRRSLAFYLRDYSALVSAVLIGIALPPYSPWWLIAVAAFFAIVVGKQLYGGLGYNPFNPAMLAYVVVLISFPVEMTRWLAPLQLTEASHSLASLLDGLAQVFGGIVIPSLDGYTAATPLDIVRQNNSQLLDDLYQQQAILAKGRWAGAGWEWANLGFALGGIYLLYKKVFTWHAPLAMLAALALMAALFYDSGSSTSAGSPLFHLLSGATMLGAFFIITDPVSSAVSSRGRLIFGAGAGVLIYLIRAWGNYPDAVAFAVLLMNFAASFIDYYTVPRAYGHSKRGGNPE